VLQVGLGEGFAPSAATSVLAWQVPSTERSRAVTTVWGGLDVGSAVGLLLSGPLIRMYGWPSVFYLFAVLGGVWCLLWPLVRPGVQVSKSLGGVNPAWGWEGLVWVVCGGGMAAARRHQPSAGRGCSSCVFFQHSNSPFVPFQSSFRPSPACWPQGGGAAWGQILSWGRWRGAVLLAVMCVTVTPCHSLSFLVIPCHSLLLLAPSSGAHFFSPLTCQQ
jgi:MFS family permease